MTTFDLALVDQARELLAGRVRRTPIEPSPALSSQAGAPVSLKLECFQTTGSFKIRGAFFVLARLSAAAKAHGIVTCSAGNHGKAVAFVARQLGIPAEIHVPANVDESKYLAMRAMGATVVRAACDGYDAAEALARAAAAASDRPYLSAFDDEAVLAANGGTIAAEVLEDAPDARTFLFPVGGGGLGGGFAVYAKTHLPDCRLIGCQHALSPALALSLARGQAVLELPPVETTAGGLEGGIGKAGFEALQSRIDAVALVTEDEIFAAVRFMLEHHQILIEPSSAVTVAAMLAGKTGALLSPAVAILTGRNVALTTVRRILCS